jgi:hypothetical protein
MEKKKFPLIPVYVGFVDNGESMGISSLIE